MSGAELGKLRRTGGRLSQVYREPGPDLSRRKAGQTAGRGVGGMGRGWDGTVPPGYCTHAAVSEEAGPGKRNLAQESGHSSVWHLVKETGTQAAWKGTPLLNTFQNDAMERR